MLSPSTNPIRSRVEFTQWLGAELTGRRHRWISNKQQGSSHGTQHKAFCAEAPYFFGFAVNRYFRSNFISGQNPEREHARILDCNNRLHCVGRRLCTQRRLG